MYKNRILRLILAGVIILLFSLIALGCEEAEAPGDDEAEPEENIAEKFDYEIIGIDPGAEMMETAEEDLLPQYGLEDYEIIEGSGPAMVAALDSAIRDEEWIAVLGWTPHWKFAEYDIKFLDDPEKVYGEAEDIRALSRKGFSDDEPQIKEFLGNFKVDDEQLGDLMGRIDEAEGDDIEVAEQWAEEHQNLVEEWVPEDADGEGREIEMLYNNWVCAISKTYLVTYILEEEMNYEVNQEMVDVGVLYETLSGGDADFMVCAWLPLTQATYWEEHGDNLEDYGPVYEGGKIGVVVPEYVDIDCISEMAE